MVGGSGAGTAAQGGTRRGLPASEVHRPDRAAVAVEASGHEAGPGHLERAVHDDGPVRRRVEPGLEGGAHPGAATVDLDDLAELVDLVARMDVRGVAEVAVAHLVARIRSRRV